MAKLVAEKMWGVTGQCTVVFHLYDNSFFMTMTEEGGLIPAVRDEVGGRYPVHGESVMVPKEMQYSTFLLSKPIMEVATVEVKRRSCCVPCRDTSTMAAAMMRSIPPTSRMRTTSLIWIMLSLPATGTSGILPSGRAYARSGLSARGHRSGGLRASYGQTLSI